MSNITTCLSSKVTMMAQHTQVLGLFINPMGGQIDISIVYKEHDFIRFCCLRRCWFVIEA